MQGDCQARWYAVHANASENCKLGYKYVRIVYLSKYSKYVETLRINMSRFYIHRGLPWRSGSVESEISLLGSEHRAHNHLPLLISVLTHRWTTTIQLQPNIFCTMAALQFPLPDPIPGIALPPVSSHPPTNDDVEHALNYLNRVQRACSETQFLVLDLSYISIHDSMQAATRQHLQNLKVHMPTLHISLMGQALVSNLLIVWAEVIDRSPLVSTKGPAWSHFSHDGPNLWGNRPNAKGNPSNGHHLGSSKCIFIPSTSRWHYSAAPQ